MNSATECRFLLGLLVAVNLVNGVLLAILTPMWLGADEYTHYGYIQHLRVKKSLPDQRTCRFSHEVEASVYESDWWRLTSGEGKVSPGVDDFYSHGFRQLNKAGRCARVSGHSHSGSSSLAIEYSFGASYPEALGAYITPLDLSGLDMIGLWVSGDGSGLPLKIGLDTSGGREHEFSIPLNFDGFKRVVIPFGEFSGGLASNRGKGALLKLYVNDDTAKGVALTGSIYIDDIWFQRGAERVMLTGFEDRELVSRDANRLNWAAHHPPLYYLMALPIELALKDRPIAERAFALRLFSLLLSSATLIVMILTARLLFTDHRSGWVLMPCLLVFSPGYSLHQVSINNDLLLILLYSLLMYLMLKWSDQQFTFRRALALGVICGLGILTKMLFLTAVFLVAAYLLLDGRCRTGGSLKKAGFMFSIFAFVVMVVSGWWFVRNYMVYGMPMITATTYLPASAVPGQLTLAEFFLSKKFLGWIGVGWLILTASSTDLYLAGAVLGLCAAGYIKGLILKVFGGQQFLGNPESARKFKILLCAIAVHVLPVLYLVSAGSLRVGRFRALHGRYFFPVIAAIAAFWALGASKLIPRKLQNQFLAAVIALLAALETSNVYITALTRWYPF